jgi:hypothetical protein
MKSQALLIYGRILDVIVTIMIFVMLLTLIGAVVGLILDFIAAATALRTGVSTHSLALGIVDSIDRKLVIDVLSVFVLIELFRSNRPSPTLNRYSPRSRRTARRRYCWQHRTRA